MSIPSKTPRPLLTRRAALSLLVLGGCANSLDWQMTDLFGGTSAAPSSGAPSCGASWGTGGPPFQYVCPVATRHPQLDASPFVQVITSGSDAFCAVTDFFVWIPAVAVGAPFQLVYDESQDGGAPTTTVPTAPAAGTLAVSTSEGWEILQPGYLGFLARQDSQVIDFTHVLARNAASIGLFSMDLSGGPALNAPPDAGGVVFEGATGVRAKVLAYPRADDGTLLGGSTNCTFASSDPSRLAVAGSGVVAEVTPLAGGDVTLTATCLGMQAVATVHITGPGLEIDAGSADGPGDADATDDGTADAGIEDGALDSGSVADAPGGQ